MEREILSKICCTHEKFIRKSRKGYNQCVYRLYAKIDLFECIVS